MDENIKQKCLKAYYKTDIDPKLERLHEVKDIVANFEKEGADRLMYALSMRHIDIEEIERFAVFISNAREKMEKELERLHKFETNFNQDFATDHNDYYNSVCEILKHTRSHMSPLKKVFKKFCPTKHPTAAQCATYGIEQKSVFEESVLGKSVYNKDLFDMSSFPPAVHGLFKELKKFFEAQEECMNLCIDILKEEKEIREDPMKCKYLLDVYKKKVYKRLENEIMLFENSVNILKEITFAYKSYVTYASDEGFAQGEYHKHNHADMDHFCIIECFTEPNDITIAEKALWGNNPKTVKKIKYVIGHFDDLLPSDFKHKQMGLYEYIFCQWALPNNVKKAVEYFINHYNGKYKVVKYNAVNNRSLQYDKNSEIVKNFFSNINKLFEESNDEDLMENFA